MSNTTLSRSRSGGRRIRGRHPFAMLDGFDVAADDDAADRGRVRR